MDGDDSGSAEVGAIEETGSVISRGDRVTTIVGVSETGSAAAVFTSMDAGAASSSLEGILELVLCSVAGMLEFALGVVAS